MRSRLDTYWLGILIGLLIPALFCGIYLENYHLWNILRTFGDGSNSILTKLFLLSTFPNLALLFVLYELDVWRLAKGVLIGAMPYLILACFYSI